MIASMRFIFSVVCALTLAASLTTSQSKSESPKGKRRDWSMFGGTPSRNFVSPLEKNLPTKWDLEAKPPKNVKWIAELGSRAFGGPTISGGKVYVGCNYSLPRHRKHLDEAGRYLDLGVMMCFRESDGKYLWQAVHRKLPVRVNDWPNQGIASSPCVEGNRLWYVSNRCELICADTEGFLDGKNDGVQDEEFQGEADADIIWCLDMIKQLGVFPHNLAVCSPLIVNDLILVVTGNGVDESHVHLPAPKAPSFLAVNKRTGKVVWSDNSPTIKFAPPKGEADRAYFERLATRGQIVQHAQWSNPAHVKVDGQDQLVFPGGDGWIYSFDIDGKLLWKFDCNPKDADFEIQGRGTRSELVGTPVIYRDRVYIGTGQDPEHDAGVGHLWSIDMRKRGDVSADLVEDSKVWPPKTRPNPDSAKIWHYGGFTTPQDRKKLRRNYYFGRTLSTCAIQDDILYAADASGFLHCLDANSGKVYWIHDCDAPIWSSPLIADGKVYMGTDGGTMLIFEHGKRKNLLAENDFEMRVRRPPIAVNDTLFVLTESKLIALIQAK